MVVDVVTVFTRKDALSELLHTNDLVLMSETIKGLRNTSTKWKEAFWSKGYKVNLGKTKVMVSSGITKDGMSKSKVDPCGVYSLRVKASSVIVSMVWYVDPRLKCPSENGDPKVFKEYYMLKMSREY